MSAWEIFKTVFAVIGVIAVTAGMLGGSTFVLWWYTDVTFFQAWTTTLAFWTAVVAAFMLIYAAIRAWLDTR